MPIRPENKHRYPKEWKYIRFVILERAKHQCEGCGLKNHSMVDRNGKLVKVVLTIAHLDHTPENCKAENLRAWCQKCHNAYDAPTRARNRWLRKLGNPIVVGAKLKFKVERKRYTVMACDSRFVIAQKPFNPKRTFQYTILDLEKKIRGADNYRCKFSYDDIFECQEALKELHSGQMEISSRNRIPLDLERVDKK